MKNSINIVGGGFTGLTMAYYLSKSGWEVNVFEKDSEIGGLAGSFTVEGESLEKFYHHWFTNDTHVLDLIKDLGCEDRVIQRPIKNGMYYANNFFKLSSPLDLLRFKALNFFNRIRLGFVVIAVRFVRDWRKLENKTATEWLKGICGEQGYKVVWEPLLKGKFGRYAETVSAVWFWNKIKLRGSSRDENGKEFLCYYKGGFASLADSMVREIKENGGKIHTNTAVVSVDTGKITTHDGRTFESNKVVLTTALPITAGMLKDKTDHAYIESLLKVQYIGNVCLTLELNKSLTDIYWLNVNDPDFPFVGLIEHTNFEPKETYKGRHIVYLSKYLPTDEKLYNLSEEEFFEYAFPFIKRMFPSFEKEWVLKYHVWKELYSQPLVTKHYSQIIPSQKTPLEGVYINTMAQIYPEDRGTNYAVREGKKMAEEFINGQIS